MTDFDYETEKSDILLLNLNISRKDDGSDEIEDMYLEPCRFIAQGLHFIVSMKLGTDNKLFCLGYGTSQIRIYDSVKGLRRSVIDSAPVSYLECQMLYNDGFIYQGGLNELIVIDEESEETVAKFICEGKVTSICLSSNKEEIYYQTLDHEV